MSDGDYKENELDNMKNKEKNTKNLEEKKTTVNRKESDDIIKHTKKIKIVEKKIVEIKDIKNESGKFLINEEIKNHENIKAK